MRNDETTNKAQFLIQSGFADAFRNAFIALC